MSDLDTLVVTGQLLVANHAVADRADRVLNLPHHAREGKK